MKTALKAIGYTLGGMLVITYLAMGSLTVAYVALSLADLTGGWNG
jgi:hypothetical protein